MSVSLSADQQAVYSQICAMPDDRQKLIFISGEAGSGKTVLLQHIVKSVRSQHKLEDVALIVAPTGVAAFNVTGSTIHSAFRFKTDGKYVIHDIDILREKFVNLQYLFIEEISMVSCTLLDAIDATLRIIRDSPKIPFGGINVIAFGDMLQLPPVQGECVLYNRLFRNFVLYELSSNLRHATDTAFRDMCGRFRIGAQTLDDAALLSARHVSFFTEQEREEFESLSLIIVTKKEPAKIVNAEKTALLKNVCSYFAHDSIITENNEKHIESAIPENERHAYIRRDVCDVPYELRLAVGSRVMLRVNLCVDDGLVNGRIGTVCKIEPDICTVNWDEARIKVSMIAPIVIKRFVSSRKWHKRVQFPLTLAWAVNVHKLQGITLDKALVRLQRGDLFCGGLLYVILSRVRRLSDIAFTLFDEKEIMRSMPPNNVLSMFHVRQKTIQR